ncbi:MAG: cation:proton antiporter [Gemmatimonadetes bacterium]|nr:cation:proton antiporter [Gemmatimonadota bacterium]
MRRALILALLFGGMQLVLPLGTERQGSQALLAFGFLILAAYTVAEMATAARLPKIVGYVAAGVLFGPSGLGTVTEMGVRQLAPVSHLAIALIAFLAGAELRWEEVRDHGVTLLKMMTSELVAAFLALFALLYGFGDFVPFLRGASEAEVLAFAMLFAAIAIVHSPAVTMALLTETGARGPVARTTLGIVLIADVAVFLLFSTALAVARALAPPAGVAPGLTVGMAVWEIGGALVVGTLLGSGVALYLRFVGRELVLFAVLIAFFGIEIARIARVELLLMFLTAGFVTENVSSRGETFRQAMGRSAVPVFVVFFALSGAGIELGSVAPLLPLVLPIGLVRAGAIWAGMRVGAWWADVGDVERRYVWMGLVSQAGVAIGLATIVAEAYGEPGRNLRTLLLALIAVNETIGPVLFRRALVAGGEAVAGGGIAGQATFPARDAAR